MSSISSSQSLSAILRRHPAWRESVDRILRILARVPAGGLIDPKLVAKLARLDTAQTLGYLNVLRRAGFGEIVVRVLDGQGLEVGRYQSVAQIPGRVENEFGDEIDVMPENIDVSFEPNRTSVALNALEPSPAK